MKCECCNSVLTPTYTRKKSKSGSKDIIYRYYKPNKAMKGENCNLSNIPAEQIENIILNEVYKVLKSPKTIASAIQEIKLHNNSNHIDIKEQDVIRALKNIETIWNALFPKEQVKIVNLLIKEIILSPLNLKIIFKNKGFVELINEASNNVTINTKDFEQTTEINISVDFRKRGGKAYVYTPTGKECRMAEANTRISGHAPSSQQINKALVSKLIQAQEWRKNMLKDKYLTISEIAKRENKDSSYICKIYNLNFLAPDIKKAILTGNTPTDLSLEQLRQATTVLNWKEQRKMWGF